MVIPVITHTNTHRHTHTGIHTHTRTHTYIHINTRSDAHCVSSIIRAVARVDILVVLKQKTSVTAQRKPKRFEQVKKKLHPLMKSMSVTNLVKPR